MIIRRVTVLPGQCLMDVALMVGGDVDGFLEHLAERNGREYTDALIPGEELEYDAELIGDLKVVNYYRTTLDGEFPATADVDVEMEAPDGVGYDIIEDDLVVYDA